MTDNSGLVNTIKHQCTLQEKNGAVQKKDECRPLAEVKNQTKVGTSKKRFRYILNNNDCLLLPNGPLEEETTRGEKTEAD